MNKFLKDFFTEDENNEILKELKNWSKVFWKIDCGNAAAIFAQRGYEDKGYGHIERIISNVGELLEKYCEILYQLNHPGVEKCYTDEFKKSFIDQLRPNLILFYTAAHLHDIGMNFAGIYKALSDLVAAGGDSALHIGEIIHKYHHYSSFIVLLELNYLEEKEEDAAKSIADCPYLLNLHPDDREQKIGDLKNLKVILKNIYETHFKGPLKKDIESENDFFVMIAILCLLHKEVNPDYVQSIIRKFRDERQETVHFFNKWWDKLNRANEWTKKLKERLPEIKTSPNRFSGCDQVLLIGSNNPGDNTDNKNKLILDLLLVEALLQYGDKTEITIARLAREIKAESEDGDCEYIPLEEFVKATKYDNQKGFICTDMAQSIISPFARFRACRFIPLILVEVQEVEEEEDGEKKIMEKLDIVFHYFRLDNDEDIFRILRYHNEKDFYDLGFLEVIRTHIPLLMEDVSQGIEPKTNPVLDINFKKEEHPLNDLTDLEGRFKSFDETLNGIKQIRESIGKEKSKENIDPANRFPYTPQNRKAIVEYSKAILDPEEKKKTEGVKKVFYETGDLIVPSSFEVMTVLNLFYEEE